MNAPIRRLFVLVARAVRGARRRHVGWTRRSTPTGAARQPAQPPRAARGAADPPRHDPRRRRHDHRAARSAATASVYSRRYPTSGLFAHAIGYSFTTLGRAGLERYRNDELTGRRNELTSIARPAARQAQRRRQHPHDARPGGPEGRPTTSSRGAKGAVVALDPRNGDVKVMASIPTYDPNLLRSPKTYSRLANDNANKPLVNRATQFGYAPGSTFKVVTATAAIDSGQFTPTRRSTARTA